MTREEALSILKNILADLQGRAKDTDNVSCCLEYGFTTYGKAKDCIKALEQESFINKPCVSSGVCEHDKDKVLDRIRTEIEQRPYGVANDSVIQGMKYERAAILKIIDKYEVEGEG